MAILATLAAMASVASAQGDLAQNNSARNEEQNAQETRGGAGAPTTYTVGPEFWQEQELPSRDELARWQGIAQTMGWNYGARSQSVFEAVRATPVPETGRPASELELEDTPRALEFYGQWLSVRRRDAVEVHAAVRLCSLSALLCLRELNNPVKALEIYDWGIALWGQEPSHVRLRIERAALIEAQRGAPSGAMAAVKSVQLRDVAPPANWKITLPSLGELPGVSSSVSSGALSSGAVRSFPFVSLRGVVLPPATTQSVAAQGATLGIGKGAFLDESSVRTPPSRSPEIASAKIAIPAMSISGANENRAILKSSLEAVSVGTESREANTSRQSASVEKGNISKFVAPSPRVRDVLPSSVSKPESLVDFVPNRSLPKAQALSGVQAAGLNAPVHSSVPTPRIETAQVAMPQVGSKRGSVTLPSLVDPAEISGAKTVLAPVTKPSVELRGLEVGHVSLSPGVTGAARGLSVAAIASNTARRSVVLEQLQAGTISLQGAWDTGALSVESVDEFLYRENGEWLVGEEKKTPGLHRKLMEILLTHEPQKMSDPKQLSPRMRLWLADYYQEKGDEKCLLYAQSILDDQKLPATTEDSLVIQAIERMAYFYTEQGKHEKSAQTWMLLGQHFSKEGWWTGDMYLMAARELVKIGKTSEAKLLRDKISNLGYGWLTALALYDEALPLMNEGKLSQARVVLSRTVRLEHEKTEFLVATHSWLASLAYQQGELDEAFRLSQVAVRAIPSRKVEGYAGHIEGLYEQAYNLYNRSGGWKNQPIQSEVSELRISLNPTPNQRPRFARFLVRTYGDQTVSASCDIPGAQVRVLPVNNWQRDALSAHEEQSEVILELPADFAKSDVAGNKQKKQFQIWLSSTARVSQPMVVSGSIKNANQ